MPKLMQGRAWVFNGLLDVDWEICPFHITWELRAKGLLDKKELGKYCMTEVDPEFPKKVKNGDFIIAEENVGYGHDHSHACLSILGAGVAAVICESSAPYFLRNSIDSGLPVVQLRGITEMVKQGDELQVDLVKGVVKNLTSGAELEFQPMPDFILEILEAGGIDELLEEKVKAGKLYR